MLIGLLLLSGAAASVWLFRARAGRDPTREARAVRAATIVLAVIGVIAFIVLTAMVLTHYGVLSDAR